MRRLATDLGMGFRSSVTGGPRAAARETYLVSLLGVWS
jgi:hypothetical protein